MNFFTRTSITLVAVALALFGVLALSGCVSNGSNASAEANSQSANSGAAPSTSAAASTPQRASQTINKGGSLTIATKALSNQAQFYPITVDGAAMEVLALKDSAGKIRTAFNTCQVCYSSGRGYYVQEGGNLVCQNCGNKFGTDQIEIKAGGCNPLPIFDGDKKTNDSAIEIPYETLKKSESFFANWKN